MEEKEYSVMTESLNEGEGTLCETMESPSAVKAQIAYLDECRKALQELIRIREKKEQLEIREKKQAKAIASEKRTLEETVNTTIRKRKEELEASYDTEISKVQDSIKKVKSKREKAKQQSMKERMKEQAAPIEAENKEMKDRIRQTLKQAGAPSFCDSALFYALYFPKTIKEIGILLLALIICFLLVPSGIYWLIPGHKIYHLIILYLSAILLFGGLYILLATKIKEPYKAVILEAQQIRRGIDKNKKKIRAQAKGIRNEKTEEYYDLSAFDEELAARTQEKAELEEKKEEAMAYFVSTTKPAITEEIVSGKRDQIAGMEEEYRQITENLTAAAETVKNETLRLSKEYESYIGKEFMTVEKMEALMKILRKGQADTITAAKEVYLEEKGKN